MESVGRGKRWQAGLGVLGAALVLAAGAYATHLAVDTEGHTTLEQVLTGDGANYETLSVEQVDEDYIVRDAATDPAPPAQAGRASRRRSLAYFSQLTDFQLADEESPARVEFVDPGASSAWRPHEAFHPFVIDASIRQVNRFVPSSPVPQGDGTGNSMDFSLITGDQADNQQRNEMIWTRELLEGGSALNFNSGITDPAYYSSAEFLSKPSCPLYLASEGGSAANAVDEAGRYTGVQDYDDYPLAPPPGPEYYDPDQPQGQYADWPTYKGLMDRAQTLSFEPAGLNVPSYWSNGNHDVLVQGNEDANHAFEDIATACFKALGTTLALPPSPPGSDFAPDPNLLLSPLSVGMLVPPDPLRRFTSKQQIKAVIGADNEDNDHGFDFVDPAENTASNNSASYYAWDPPQTPGLRFVNIDTNSEGGQTAEGVASGSSNGNIDDPQFQWLRSELDAAQASDKLIVIFGHHPVRSMSTEIVDEQALPCVGPNHSHGDDPEHNINPGCDPDPRISAPIHLGRDEIPGDPRESFVELLDDYPNVLAYVAGHTHEHRLIPFERTDGSNWWEINSSATADWPQQHRLVDIMDNRDGTLSLFGTVLDAAAPSTAPDEGPADSFDSDELASIGRTLSFNDPQNNFSGEGSPRDRNVEMLVGDPREANLSVEKSDNPDPVVAGSSLIYTVEVENNDDPSDASGATGVKLTDHLPPTVTFVSANPSQGTCGTPSGVVLTCDLGDLASGATATVTITVTPQTAGTISNTAEVSAVTADPNRGNNRDTETTTVNPVPALSADLSISKTATPPQLFVGGEITYALSVANAGPDPAGGVAITDVLPGGVGFVSATASQGSCLNVSGTVTCNLGTLADGASATAEIKVSAQTAGAKLNQATVASAVADPASADNSSSASSQVLPQPGPGPGTGPQRGSEGGGGQGTATCKGRPATIIGTGRRDRIKGTSGNDVIAALGGKDKVRGGKGRDLICGGKGADDLRGGSGKDFLSGNKGNDVFRGGKERDRIRGGKGNDRCRGDQQGCSKIG